MYFFLSLLIITLNIFAKEYPIKSKAPKLLNKDSIPIPKRTPKVINKESKVIGSMMFVPATAGILCANYVIKDIIGEV